ncbi:hypothetical protein PR003_g17522 [Phytophthora rubi]|uniref:Uncharacterized protein n=1 Tax=Phytophthora rubi TaxID=129364 RepID=A0A6A3IUZ6_9STRA|nr:hypothetical protein PR001_g22475 [Phytophthora rubi]KAE9005260.1 hypothetical protein PR002_g16812 [Phytophthora rubi]KAE9321209.1 hypothetical protein PR003_g17522 [Phytophthora rubi]
MDPTKKRTKGLWLTIKQKCEIIDEHNQFPTHSLPELSCWAQDKFKLSHPPATATIFRVLRDANIIKQKRVNATTAKGRTLCVRCPELETQLAAFVMGCQRKNVCLSRRLIEKKAKRIMATVENPPSQALCRLDDMLHEAAWSTVS